LSVVTIHAAKTNLSKLIARAEAGEEIVIARGKQPVVRLAPMEVAAPKPQRVPGAWAGKIKIGPEFFEPLPEKELRLWEGRGDD
jgi:prevent-host-death family protein